MKELLYDLIILYAVPLFFTFLIEVPLISAWLIRDVKPGCSMAVNALTNVPFNLILSFITGFTGLGTQRTVYMVLCEFIIIPVSEGLLYSKLSDRSLRRCMISSYIANAVSFGLGLLIMPAMESIIKNFF